MEDWNWETIFTDIIHISQSAKLEVGERYIQVRAHSNGRVPFPNILTSLGGGKL